MENNNDQLDSIYLKQASDGAEAFVNKYPYANDDLALMSMVNAMRIDAFTEGFKSGFAARDVYTQDIEKQRQELVSALDIANEYRNDFARSVDTLIRNFNELAIKYGETPITGNSNPATNN